MLQVRPICAFPVDNSEKIPDLFLSLLLLLFFSFLIRLWLNFPYLDPELDSAAASLDMRVDWEKEGRKEKGGKKRSAEKEEETQTKRKKNQAKLDKMKMKLGRHACHAALLWIYTSLSIYIYIYVYTVYTSKADITDYHYLRNEDLLFFSSPGIFR